MGCACSGYEPDANYSSESSDDSSDDNSIDNSVSIADRRRAKLQSILEKGSIGEKVPYEISFKVQSCVYSEATRTLYVTDGNCIQPFNCRNSSSCLLRVKPPRKTGIPVQSLALAPSVVATEDSLYVSTGYGTDQKKVVLCVSGPLLDKEANLDIQNITEDCYYWVIDSNPNLKVLVIHPYNTTVFYFHAYGALKKKIDLKEMGITKGISQAQMVGRKFLIGNSSSKTVDVYDLVLTESQCTIDQQKHWGPIQSKQGSFGAVSLDPTSKQGSIYVITKTKRREKALSVFRYGDKDCKEPVQDVDVKKSIIPLMAIAHESRTTCRSCLLLVGKNADDYLCGVVVKRLKEKTPLKRSAAKRKNKVKADKDKEKTTNSNNNTSENGSSRNKKKGERKKSTTEENGAKVEGVGEKGEESKETSKDGDNIAHENGGSRETGKDPRNLKEEQPEVYENAVKTPEPAPDNETQATQETNEKSGETEKTQEEQKSEKDDETAEENGETKSEKSEEEADKSSSKVANDENEKQIEIVTDEDTEQPDADMGTARGSQTSDEKDSKK